METKVHSLDLDRTVGSVTLSNGQRFDIPKLSIGRIIKVTKFIAIDGSRLYNELQEVITDESMDMLERFAVVLENLKEEQVVQLFAILLDMKPEEVLALDPNELLEIAIEYVDHVDLKKTYSLIRQFMKKLFNRDLPENPKDIWTNLQSRAQQMQMQMIQQQQAMASSDSSTQSSNKSN